MQDQDAATPINIHLMTLQQLFNSFDPSPFHNKDLDADAHEYIVGSVDEYSLQKNLKLVIEIPADEFKGADASALPDSIHNYFSYRAEEVRRKIRFLMREGRSALLIGLSFLVVCTSLRQLTMSFAEPPFAGPLSEGLLILGWVAMWRPIQIFLYDWWPVHHNRRLYAKLATMPVEVRAFEP
ncbi:MAG: hypothetical protein K2P94_03525 [Rhodospirillaceae bacterium]|nr:hypothetical protein [Rhodospirillaceae bacterium]